jgi:hypothetical protein
MLRKQDVLSGSCRLISILASSHRGTSTTKLTTRLLVASGYRGTSCQNEIG